MCFVGIKIIKIPGTQDPRLIKGLLHVTKPWTYFIDVIKGIGYKF